MWSTNSSGSGATGPARAANAAGPAGDTTGKGWESVNLFHAYSAAQGRPLQATQQQREQQLRPLPFPESAPPAALAGFTAAIPGDTRVTSNSTPSRSLETATRGVSSSRAGPRMVFLPSTPRGPLQEQAYQEVHQRPSPWQGRSPQAPLLVTAAPLFAGNRTNSSQPGRYPAVPNTRGRYADGPHALYLAARIPAPLTQPPRLQRVGQIPQQTAFQTSQQSSAKPLPPSRPHFPSTASCLGSTPAGTSAEHGTPIGPSQPPDGPPLLAAGVTDPAAPSAVFPDATTVDEATPAGKQSSKDAAAPPVDFLEIETRQECNRAGGRVKPELLKESLGSGPVEDTDRGVTAKQDSAPGLQGKTQLSSESLHTSRLQRDSHPAQGDADQAAAQQPSVSPVSAADETSGGNMYGGIRQRSVQGVQQQQAHTQQRSTQGRDQQQLVHDAVDGMSKETRPTLLAETEGGKLSLWARSARFYHEVLQVLQLNASDLIPLVSLPYLGPFDMMLSELPQSTGISSGLIGNETGSSPFMGTDGGCKLHVQQSQLLSTGNGGCTFGYGDLDACGIQSVLKQLYAEAGSHLEQLRFRRLYSPTMAGTSAVCFLTCLLFFFFMVPQNLTHYVRVMWTSSSALEARPLLAPHSFAVGVLSLSASACVLLAAVFSFFFFQQHLRTSNLYHKIRSSNSNTAAAGAASQKKPLFPHHTYLPPICTKDAVPTATQRVQDSLGEEYQRLYTMCARGDLLGCHTHAVETADAALKSYLDSSKQHSTQYELRRQSDRDGEKEKKTEMRHPEECDLRKTSGEETEDKVERSTAPTESLSPTNLTSREAFSHIMTHSVTRSPEQQSKDCASFIQDVTDKNLLAYTTFVKDANADGGGQNEAGLVTASDMGLRNYSLRTVWLTLGYAVTAAVARMLLTLLLGQAVTPGVPSSGKTAGATAATWNTTGGAAEDLFFPAHPLPAPSTWWERLKTDWYYRGGSVPFARRIHSADASGPTLPQLPTTAATPTATPVLTALWTALNRLATFQMQSAGFMFLTQFVAVALILQPREELRLTPVMARIVAFLQLGMSIVELLCTGFNALTLILGELALKEALLVMVHLAGQRLVQLSRENFAARITYRSRLPATSSTAAAAGALLASACSERGAAAAEVFLAERRKKLRWGRNSILRHPSETAQKSSSPG